MLRSELRRERRRKTDFGAFVVTQRMIGTRTTAV